MPQIIWLRHAGGPVDYFNRRWFEYTGLSVEQGAATSSAVIHPGEAAAYEAAWARATATHAPCQLELRLRRADGQYRWHLAQVVPDDSSDGDPAQFICTFTDISGQKDAQERADRAYQDAKEAIRVRDEFLSVASHELRTPLSALRLEIDLLTDRARREPAVRVEPAQLERVARQVNRLQRLTTELLEISRIASGRLKLELEPVELTALVREMVAQLQVSAQLAGSTIVVAAAAPVPGCWDRLRLEQVVAGLLSNAIKFGAGLPIEVTVEDRHDRARLVVRDHGIGIGPEDIGRVFAPFERVLPARAYGGLGLGLFLVRQIVEAHGGKIGVESQPGAGSQFTVELPRGGPVADPKRTGG
jgi:PAS domain S-box-containing protein